MAPPASTELDEPVLVPRRRIWPVLAVLMAITVGGAFFLYRLSKAPRPNRVLVAFDVDGYWWEGSEPAALLSDQLGERLGKLGFDVVKAGDPEVTKVLEKAKSPAEAAKALQAGFVIEARLQPEEIKHEKIGFVELRVDAPVTVTFSGEAGKEAGRITGFSGAKDPKVARRLLASAMADQAFDLAVPAVLAHPAIQAILEKRATGEAASLAPAKEFAEKRTSMTKNAVESYEKLRKQRLDGELGPVKPTYLSPASAHDELAAVTPLGWLRSANDVRPFYVAGQQAMGYINELELLEWRSVDEPTKAVPLWKGYNLYGYPSAEPTTGAPVVLVEDLFGWAKTITVIDKSGKAKRVRVDTAHRFVDPKVAPGGRYAAMWDRPCQTCTAELLVVRVTDGETVFTSSPKDGVISAYTFVDGHTLALLETPKVEVPLPDQDKDKEKDKEKDKGKKGDKAPDTPEAPKADDDDDDAPAVPQHLFVLDLDAPAPARKVVTKAPPGERWATPRADAAGKRVVVETRKGMLAVLDLGTGEARTITVPGAATWPSFSPDGAWIAFELHAGGQPGEIAATPAAGGVVQVLTKNTFRDRFPLFSSDGKRIVYETIDEDPTFPKHRLIVWVASVPAPR